MRHDIEGSTLKHTYVDRLTQEEVEQLTIQMQERFDDDRGLDTLKVFVPLSLADRGQMLEITGLSRPKLDLVIETFEEIGGDRILKLCPLNIRRPDKGRGRPPSLFLLGPDGAAILRANGFPDAKACGLTEEHAISHSRALLDLHHRAQKDGLVTQVETEIRYDLESEALHSIRADLMLEPEDSERCIYEIEQAATTSHLSRIVKGLRNRHAFFLSPESAGISHTTGILFNMMPGNTYDQSKLTWGRAFQIVMQEVGGNLSFRPIAATLPEFLAAPDWSGKGKADYWDILVDPVQLPNFSPSKAKKAQPQPIPKVKVPHPIRRYTAQEDHVILQAFWQDFQKNGPSLPDYAGDPIFFDTMSLIYLPSHPRHATAIQQAAAPKASLFMLNRYFVMQPELRKAISYEMSKGSTTYRSLTLFQHRMQRVIHRFLHYHGFRSCQALYVQPVSSWDHERGSSGLDILVRIDPDLLMREGDVIVPSREDVRLAEDALAWVLLALFNYSDDLNIKRPKFW